MLIGGPQRGFTLIELIVVISIISLMLFFTMPNLGGALWPQGSREASRWIIHAEKTLRENAIRHNTRYTLHIDLPTGKIWFSNKLMKTSEIEKLAAKAMVLPRGVVISEIEFPLKNKTVLGRAEIHFYPKGYADKAIIRVNKGHYDNFNLLIEPFIPGVRVIKDE